MPEISVHSYLMEITAATRVGTYLGAEADHPVINIYNKHSQAGHNGDEESWEPPGLKKKKRKEILRSPP